VDKGDGIADSSEQTTKGDERMIDISDLIHDLETASQETGSDMPRLGSRKELIEARNVLQDRFASIEMRNKQLEDVCCVANQAYSCVDEWWGSASTKQAARDSMWRLGRALRQAGYDTDYRDNIDWRGSILKELNDSGFYPSTNDPYNANAPDFVYDPDAPNNSRIFGNAKGPTIRQIVFEWKALKGEIHHSLDARIELETKQKILVEFATELVNFLDYGNLMTQKYHDLMNKIRCLLDLPEPPRVK
jgi:hypothetical protein